MNPFPSLGDSCSNAMNHRENGGMGPEMDEGPLIINPNIHLIFGGYLLGIPVSPFKGLQQGG